MLFRSKNTFSKNAHPLSQKRPLTAKNGYYFIWGYHAVTAALSNPNRVVRTFYASTKTKEMALNLIQNATCKTATDSLKLMILDVEKFSLSPDSSEKRVHQQLMIEVKPLEITDLTDILFATKHLRLVVLDQITDPRNIGAIIRSAKAFGCDAVIISKHNAPAENGSLARAAAGALRAGHRGARHADAPRRAAQGEPRHPHDALHRRHQNHVCRVSRRGGPSPVSACGATD